LFGKAGAFLGTVMAAPGRAAVLTLGAWSRPTDGRPWRLSGSDALGAARWHEVMRRPPHGPPPHQPRRSSHGTGRPMRRFLHRLNFFGTASAWITSTLVLSLGAATSKPRTRVISAALDRLLAGMAVTGFYALPCRAGLGRDQGGRQGNKAGGSMTLRDASKPP